MMGERGFTAVVHLGTLEDAAATLGARVVKGL